MADTSAAPDSKDWPDQGVRQRLGSRIERHVLRSAVDMLDERGQELDRIEQELVQREEELSERLAQAAADELQLERREARLHEVGAGDLHATHQIDLLVRRLEETEGAAAAYRAKAEGKILAAEEKARELAEKIRRLEDAEHNRVLSAADITRRESTLRTREHELRQHDERLCEREQAIAAQQHALIAKKQRIEEAQRGVETARTEAATRTEALARREREVEERESALHGRESRWWGSPAQPQ